MSLLLSVSTGWLFGQTLQVDYSREQTATIGQEIQTNVTITNRSDKPVSLIIQRSDINLGTSQKTWFCWKSECYGEGIDEIPIPIRLAPGESTSNLRIMLTTGISEGVSNASYLIMDRGEPSSAVNMKIDYNIENSLKENSLFTSPQINIKDLYPNPVRDFLMVEYKVSDPEAEYKIFIHSVLGSIVGEHILQTFDTSLRIPAENLNSGIYFLSLYIDNEGVMTKKFIIQE